MVSTTGYVLLVCIMGYALFLDCVPVVSTMGYVLLVRLIGYALFLDCVSVVSITGHILLVCILLMCVLLVTYCFFDCIPVVETTGYVYFYVAIGVIRGNVFSADVIFLRNIKYLLLILSNKKSSRFL